MTFIERHGKAEMFVQKPFVCRSTGTFTDKEAYIGKLMLLDI